MSEDEINSMTMNDYEEYEVKRMEKNAWFVADDLANRVDGAPVLSSFIHGLVSFQSDDHFFFNKKELKVYNSASDATKKDVPGYNYFDKIYNFIDNHYEHGELYIEYLKGDCVKKCGELCSFCRKTEWTGPVMGRIPRPIPDKTRLPEYHYQAVFDTPCTKEDGTPREPDDFMPRAQLRKAFAEGHISLDDTKAIDEFADKHIVQREYVVQYITHLQNLQRTKAIRDRTKKAQKDEKKNKTVQDYNWQQIIENGTLGKLTVPELDKYLNHHALPLKGKKADKVRTIITHMSSDVSEIAVEHDDNLSDEDEDDDDEEILGMIDSDEDSDDSDEDDEMESTEDNEDDDETNEDTEDICDQQNDIHLTPPFVSNVSTRSGRSVRPRVSHDYLFY